MKVYLYILSNHGTPFYVGITKDLKQRLQYHCGSPSERTYSYIQKIEGGYPELNIVGIFERGGCIRDVEKTFILYFCSLGYKLCNDDGNPIYNRIVPDYTCRKSSIKRKYGYAKEMISKALETYYKHKYWYDTEKHRP